MRDRHLATLGVERESLQLIEMAPVRWKAHANINLVRRMGRAIGGHLQAVGDQLYGTAHRRDISPQPCRGGPVHVEPPLHAGQAAVILDITKAAQPGHLLTNGGNRLGGVFILDCADFQRDRLAPSGSHLLLAKLQYHAGKVGGALGHVAQYRPRRAPLVPVDQLKLQGADHIAAQLLVGNGVGAGIQRLHFAHAGQPRLHSPHNGVFLEGGKIPA